MTISQEVIADLLFEARGIKKFNDSFILIKPHFFNYQAKGKNQHHRDCAAVLSFLKDAEGIYAILNKKIDRNTDLLLNILIDKLHLNIIGIVNEPIKTKLKNIYLTQIIFKDLSKQDRNKILQFINPKRGNAIIDKRKYARFNKSIPVTYQVYKQNKTLKEHPAVVYTIDISQYGAKMVTEEKLHINDKLYIQIRFHNKTIFCTGKIIWTKYSEDKNKCLVGLKFASLSQQTKENLLELIAG